MNMYEESVKVPFLMAGAGVARAGEEEPRLLSHYDFLPTVLETLHLPPLEPAEAATLPGKSFAQLLQRGDSGGGRVGDDDDDDAEAVVYDEYGAVRMIRTTNWKYIQEGAAPRELYHLAADPEETTSLVDDASAGGKLAELQGRLADWFEKHVDPAHDGLHLPVTGSGQGKSGPDSFNLSILERRK
jgi:arylsulfatase A-like enzyme